MMFVYCCDEETKTKLLTQGYQLLKKQGNTYVFANDVKKQFSNELQGKVIVSNRITF